MRVYLAGPDVFLPDPVSRGAALKSICARHGLVGVFPLDALANEPAAWASLPEAQAIALRNEAHITSCAALIANLTPFRGPSADAGTIFELGFMRALGRPVFGWSNTTRSFTDRTLDFLGTSARRNPSGAWTDSNHMLVESFGLTENLMIDGAILASGGTLSTTNTPHDLTAFEHCAAAVGRYFRK